MFKISVFRGKNIINRNENIKILYSRVLQYVIRDWPTEKSRKIRNSHIRFISNFQIQTWKVRGLHIFYMAKNFNNKPLGNEKNILSSAREGDLHLPAKAILLTDILHLFVYIGIYIHEYVFTEVQLQIQIVGTRRTSSFSNGTSEIRVTLT